MAFWNNALITAGGTAQHLTLELGPAIQSSVRGAAEKVGQPMSHIGDHFRNIGPALTYNIVYQVQANIAPAISNTVARVGDIMVNIGPAVKQDLETAVARCRNAFGEKFEKAPQILLQSVEEAQSWIKANPGKTALLVVSALVLVAPVILVGPALAGLGFGAGGVTAGSAAAGIQAGIGSVAAGSAFAILQSAGAGGAGLLVVNGIVSGVAGIGIASGIAASVLQKKAIKESEEGDGEEEGEGNEE